MSCLFRLALALLGTVLVLAHPFRNGDGKAAL
jgi:hypothetical protein